MTNNYDMTQLVLVDKVIINISLDVMLPKDSKNTLSLEDDCVTKTI